jgi:hypothetical protein
MLLSALPLIQPKEPAQGRPQFTPSLRHLRNRAAWEDAG